MNGLFEHLAAFDDGQNKAGRQASAVAQKRVKDRLGNYLKVSSSPEEYKARLDFVMDDVRQIVADVAEEYNADLDHLQEVIEENLGDGVTDVNNELENAPSAVGHKPLAAAGNGHRDDCTCGFCSNAGSLGKKDNEESDKETEAVKADEEFEKSGDDDLMEEALGHHDSSIKEALSAKDYRLLAHLLATAPGGPNPELAEHFANALTGTNPLFDRDRFIAAAGGEPMSGRDVYREPPLPPYEPSPEFAQQMEGIGKPLASTHTAEADRDGGGAVKREKLPKGDGKSVGDGPSPKIDKKKWKPNALNPEGNLPPLKTEQNDSPKPTQHQDIVDTPDYEGDFLRDSEGGKGVSDQVELPSADWSGQSSERNISQDGQSDTWHTNEGADPVTSEVFAGFVASNEAESAIREFEAEKE